MIESVEYSLKGKLSTNGTRPLTKIIKHFVYFAKLMFCRRAIVNFTVSAFICHWVVFLTVLAIQKAYRQNGSFFHFDEQRWQATIDIASSNFEENGSY